jgi:hypothetical protein
MKEYDESSEVVSKISIPDYGMTYKPPECLTHAPPILKSYNKLYDHSLPKGQYDINYVIRLLRIIVDQVEKQKMNPSNIAFSLTESCKRLIAHLETERDQ